ncbi:acyloxyacyl hydrolase [Flavobacterium phycosphaerae]|uniref:acyloxyacyl hydrolase n=1 Tax=Flavobacterium phycosphaerae TaxID=2697515 RepID=UPI001389D00B|nr:acyloxyacyl hydrolase [Flavobacterium phycosphaerae]
MKHFYCFLLLVSGLALAQQKDTYAIEVSALRGNVLPHKEDMYHLINGHPEGLMVRFLVKTHGRKEWQKAFNFPDYGTYFLYQDFKSEPLGSAYAVGGFYNFYFWKRRLQLQLAQGFAMTTNPYDKETNSKNKAFGTKILDNTNFGLTYTNQTLFKNIGFHAGLFFAHYSNGRVRSPNSGINTYSLNLGVNYNFNDEKAIVNDTTGVKKSYREPIKYNFVLRTGINESPIIGSGQRPFYHIGFYADKRLNRKSALQLGTELFLTNSFKDYIKYFAVAYPEKNIDPNTDYKRVGVFVGHELFINRVSLEAQLGYYVYQPFKKDIAIYDRVGIKYYVTDKIFTSFAVKTHLFLAEALEFGVGVRL